MKGNEEGGLDGISLSGPQAPMNQSEVGEGVRLSPVSADLSISSRWFEHEHQPRAGLVPPVKVSRPW